MDVYEGLVSWYGKVNLDRGKLRMVGKVFFIFVNFMIYKMGNICNCVLFRKRYIECRI